MSPLITELEREHQQILEELDGIKDLGATSPEGRRRLVALGKLIMAHLEQEERQVYPRLRRAASGDPRLKKTLDFFAGDAEQMQEFARRFFEVELSQGDDLAVAQGFGTLRARLAHRVRREETVLFAELERLASAGDVRSA